MPVQFFDGPRERGSELEVLLPPFVQYDLEPDLELHSDDFLPGSVRGEAVLHDLGDRWDGFALPDLLLCLLRGGMVPDEFLELRVLRPRVTVLFIRSIVLPPSMQHLFREPVTLLYDFFGRDEDAGSDPDVSDSS